MIAFHWKSRFGNQLFQYCLGQILHRQTGLAVYFPPTFAQDKLHRRPVIGLWRPRSRPGRVLDGPPLTYADPHHWDPQVLQENRPLIMCGWWQQYEYYRPWKGQIRKEWLPLPPLTELGSQTVVVHVRRGDYCRQYMHGERVVMPCTSPSVLYQAIEMMRPFQKLLVLTDEPRDRVNLELRRRYRAEIHSGPLTRDFLLLAAARRLVISESTFSWWATFLGRAERVICPQNPQGFWSTTSQLRVDDEPRFEYPVLDG